MPRAIQGAIGLLAGCLISVAFFGATLKQVGAALLAGVLLAGSTLVGWLVTRVRPQPPRS